MTVINGVTNGHSSSDTTSNGTSSNTPYNGPSSAPITNGHSNGTSNTTTTNGHSDSVPLPILISGGGCVGLFLALLLSHSTPPIPNPIIVIEPQTPDPTSTRAMAHQPPTYPILSRVPGLLPELIAAGSLSTGLCFRTSVANGSRVIAEKRFDNAGAGIKGKGQLLLPQGAFQEILMARLSARPGVDVRVGWRVTSFTSSTAATASVHVATANHAGHTRDVEATYLIGADGAHSLVRTHLGLPFDGATLSAQLVACDIRYPFAAHDFHDANFIIDPADYGLVGRILPATATAPALWRVSYGVPAGEDEDRVRDGVHEKLSRMLPGLDIAPADYEVVRVAPYTPHQRLASTLYTDRVCLVGDAAHLTNPYAGLGLASGIADTSALADVLSRILTSRASDPEKLLGEWSAARRQVFLDVVDKPSRAAYARVRSDVSSEEKMAELIGRDRLVGALKKGMPVLPGSLETRGEDLEGW